MTKKQEQEGLGTALTTTELWFERNSKRVTYCLIGIFAVAAVIFGYWQLISKPREAKAADMIAQAQYRFEAEAPDYRLALDGDAAGAGFLDVIDKYGSTPTGNLAKHYAGICYLQLGEWENAANYLAKYSPARGVPAQIINAQNLGLQGDVAVEREDLTAAIRFYEKAVEASENDLTAPMYLRKAALAAHAAGDNEQAIAFAERIYAEYPASPEARNVERLIGSMQ